MHYQKRISFSHISKLFLLCFGTQVACAGVSAVLPLVATEYGTSIIVDVTIGNQTFSLLPDTGSADLWVLGQDWKCYYGKSSETGPSVPRSVCEYGNRTYTESSTFEPIDDAWFGEHYGAGDVLGTLGYDTVRIGDISVPRQEFAIANATMDVNDKRAEGILGLASAVLTSAHPADYSASSALGLLGNRLWYETTALGMAAQGMDPYFAFALDRMPLDQQFGPGGYLSFGAMPPGSPDLNDFVTVPVEITKTIPASFTNGTKKITEWTLNVEAVTWSNKTDSTPWQAVVDTGNYYFAVPPHLAADLNADFDPPGVLTTGPIGPQYSVQCDASPPTNVGWQIGGTVFNISAADMIYRNDSGNCFSTVSPSEALDGIQLFFLGDFFLHNVFAVFDFGAQEMRFAARTDNSISTQPTPTPSTGAASIYRATLLPFALMVVLGVIIFV